MPSRGSHHTVAFTDEDRRLFLAWRAAQDNARHAAHRENRLLTLTRNGHHVPEQQLWRATADRVAAVNDSDTAYRAYLTATTPADAIAA